MIRINYSGNHHNLKLAVNHVNNLLQQTYFYNHIQQRETFDMADITPVQLAELIRTANTLLYVDLYYSVLPFSKDLAYDDPEHTSMIYLNKWNINRSTESLCNTLIHQCVHAINAIYPQFSFGHGDNNPEGKENTAPYWIAALAERLIADDNSVYAAMNNDDITNIPFLQKFKPAVPQKRLSLL